jgi:hypothetical protein
MNKVKVAKRLGRSMALKYLVRHPLKGTRNLLALRGAKSLVTKKGAAMTAAVATTAVAVPVAMWAVSRGD